MLLQSICPKNILSFGDDQAPIELKPLNLLIGHNGAGKSNLLECIGLLQAAPREFAKPIRESGGVREWLWKSRGEVPVARLEAVIEFPEGKRNLRYWTEFTASGQRFDLTDERIENEHPDAGHDKPYFYFAYQNGRPVINVISKKRELKREDINPELSILSQRRAPDAYPEITWLGEAFGKIRIYRDWYFGGRGAARLPQKPDMPNDFLLEGFENLGAVLHKLTLNPELKQRLLGYLRVSNPAVQDIETPIHGGAAQVYIREDGFATPIARLSEGFLRYLCLLAILLNPTPPPLIALEEPELGLHPDILPVLADLLREASTRTQIVVTTHSDLLVEEFMATPECILTFERQNGRSVARRLETEELEAWLDKYTLGQMRQQHHEHAE